MKLIEFLQENEDWKEKLESAPYSLIIREEGNLVLFKYNQIESDFSEPIVQECRGIILERGSWNVVCHPFHKFFNYGEVYAADIDWSAASVQSKEDGSLIKVYFYNNEWKIATNGTIDAFEAPLDVGLSKIKNFGELFLEAVKNTIYDESRLFSQLEPEYTHLFELCTPYNRVVVPYKDAKIFYLSSKHNKTGEEKMMLHTVPKPKTYNLNSIEDVIAVAQELGYDEEGYVVVDKHLNRVKVKSPAYLAAHRLKGEGVVTFKRVLEMILTGEHEEFLVYFPEYKEMFDDAENRMNKYTQRMESLIQEAEIHKDKSRKDFALWAKGQENPSILFSWLDGRVDKVDDFIKEIHLDKLVKILENE